MKPRNVKVIKFRILFSCVLSRDNELSPMQAPGARGVSQLIEAARRGRLASLQFGADLAPARTLVER
jgi:hypothetical protein